MIINREEKMDDRKQYETMATLRAYASEIAAEPSRDLRPSQARIAYAEKVARMAELVKSLDQRS